MLTAAILQKLAAYDTPTICNVIELFDVRPRDRGYLDARIKAIYPEMPPMVGYAATATFRASLPPRRGDGYGNLETQVERFAECEGPPVVVFQDADDPSVAATCGEIMCSAYRAFGAQGLITSGTVRDIDQVRRIGLPLFATGINCSHGYIHIPQLQVPVHVGGWAIFPNDLLHGDCNGVTTIPKDIAAEVADACEDFVAAESVTLSVLQGAEPTLAAMKEARAEASRMIETLRRRVSRSG